MLKELLAADITTAAVVWTASAVGAAFFLLLFLQPTARRMLKAVAAVGAGAIVGILVMWLVTDVFNVFGIDFSRTTDLWFAALLAALALAAVSFRRNPRWRKIVAAVSVPVFVVVGGLGINADIGLNRSIGALMGISTAQNLDLGKPATTNADAPQGPLWEHWTPPAGMPQAGQKGKTTIPATVSGFEARDAGIYRPPAALVENPPQLPLVVMLMGQPGNPDPSFIGGVLDKYAAANNGLAPIVIVADQIGPKENDTLCVDSTQYGNVESYIMKDVVDFAKAHLNILKDPKYWTIAGYSNGGQCAISLGAKHPDVFGNILDISGEEYPGAENAATNLATVFHGDQAAYDAEKPVNIMAGKKFADTTAIFTAGALDTAYIQAAKTVYNAATLAGMATTYYEVPNAGHLIDALEGGLNKGFEVLYPRLGLSR